MQRSSKRVQEASHSADKKQKVSKKEKESPQSNMEAREIKTGEVGQVSAQFKNDSGEVTGAPFELPLNITVDTMCQLVNKLLEKEEAVPYSFFVGETEVTQNLARALEEASQGKVGSERTVEIVYQPQAVFKVRAVTRCTSSITGHSGSVLCLAFSPDGRYLASGSGDKTVRLWDINTECPQFTCYGHSDHVLSLAWSPDGKKLASGCKKGEVCLWDPETGKQLGKPKTSHKKFINALVWKPLHLDSECRYLASGSKDGSIFIWDTLTFQCHLSLHGHPQSVTHLRWGGTDLLYSGSRDTTIRVWRASDGKVVRDLKGHGHGITFLALNTDFVMRTGAFDPANAKLVHDDISDSPEELKQKAKQRYDAVKGSEPERLVSGSDDNTMFLWSPETSSKPVVRMTGHSGCVYHVAFSPDTRLLASASSDKSVKLWDGRTGKFLATLRGHVRDTYRLTWSPDSRLLVSCSADSTLKLWDCKAKKLLHDLPGHADQVFDVDWSPDSQRVVSGGADKVLKIWRP